MTYLKLDDSKVCPVTLRRCPETYRCLISMCQHMMRNQEEGDDDG